MSGWYINYKILFIGALTNKNFSFELRNWEIEKLILFDPTTSFGYYLKLLINSKKILSTEPTYSNFFSKYIFINDKSRYFFDGLLLNLNNSSLNILLKIIKTLCLILFVFEYNILKDKLISFFYIFYNNLGVDILCLLSLFKQKYYFIKLNNISNKKFDNTLESRFLINNLKLENSNFCLLFNINTKLEATGLNLILKQRNLKGNFKLLSISSFFNLTVNLKILGVSSKLILVISEGLHPLCQTLKYEKNSSIILNSQFLELNSGKFLTILFWHLKKFINYCFINIVNCSIYESGLYYIFNLLSGSKILLSFTSIYFLDLTQITNYNFIVKNLDLTLSYFTGKFYLFKVNKIYLTHIVLLKNFYIKFINYFTISVKNFYQDSSMFFNTQGFVKKNFKLFGNSKLSSSWKFLRIILNNFSNKIGFHNYNFFINYNLLTKSIFLKFIYLLLLAKKCVNFNNIINNTNQFLYNKINIIYNLKIKFSNLRLKFWLNDFFIGGKDNFSYNSTIMLKCSRLNRLQLTNFF